MSNTFEYTIRFDIVSLHLQEKRQCRQSSIIYMKYTRVRLVLLVLVSGADLTYSKINRKGRLRKLSGGEDSFMDADLEYIVDSRDF